MRDWTQIEAEYIAGDMSIRELAQRLGVSYSTLSKMASRGSWTAKRKKMRQKVAKKALAGAQARYEKKLNKLINATERAMDTALKTLEDNEQFRRWIVTEGKGDGISRVEERVFNKTDTKALRDLTGVLRDLTVLARDFYGLPAPAQSVSQKIAKERLALEKRKTDAILRESEARLRGETPQEIHVVLAEEAEELSE